MSFESLVVLDVQATGLRPDCGDRIIEVALARIERGHVTARYDSLVNSGMPVPEFITVHTGISQDMVDDAPPAAEVLRHVAAFMGDTPVAAHNATFAQRMLLGELWGERIGMVVEPFLCSHRLAQRIYPGLKDHCLTSLARALQLAHRTASLRAADEVEVTTALMLRMARDIGTLFPGVAASMQLLRQIQQMDVVEVLPYLEEMASLCA